MAINKDEQRERRDRVTRKPQQPTPEALQQRAVAAYERELVRAALDAQESGLIGLIRSGSLTRLIIRGDDLVGFTFTVKAVLPGQGAVYVHGNVRTSQEMARTIDQVIDKGRWHTDRYAPKD